MSLTLFFIAACLVFVAILLWAEYRGASALKWVAKPAASICFILVALTLDASGSVFGHWVLAGLSLSALGDVLLIPKARAAFLGGMGAFAAAHAAYIGAFAGGAAPGVLFAAASLGMAAFAFFTLKWLWPHLAEMRWPVAGYALIISVMVAASPLGVRPDGTAPDPLLMAAALGFAIADIAVAREQFGRSTFINRLWGLPLYYGAQLLFALSV